MHYKLWFKQPIIHNFTPAPFKNTAFSSSGHLGLAGKSMLLDSPSLYFSNPTIAISAALSLHKFIGGNIGSNFSFKLKSVSFFLMVLFEATDPAITKVFFLFLFVFLNSLNATLLF